MRHTDLKLIMKVYTDPRIFNLAAAVNKLPIPAVKPTDEIAVKSGIADAGIAPIAPREAAGKVAIATSQRDCVCASVNDGSESMDSQTADLGGDMCDLSSNGSGCEEGKKCAM